MSGQAVTNPRALLWMVWAGYTEFYGLLYAGWILRRWADFYTEQGRPPRDHMRDTDPAEFDAWLKTWVDTHPLTHEKGIWA